MSRYTISFVTPCPPQQVIDTFEAYLTSEGFNVKSHNGESYWGKGIGLLLAPQCIKLNYQNNAFVIEAWTKIAVLPAVYVGEMGLDGFFGCIPKSMLKSKVDTILAMLQAQPLQQKQVMPYGNPSMPPQPQQMPYGNPNMLPQVQNGQATQQNQYYQPVNQYNQGR